MTEVWLSAGLRLPYRVASWERSYGEFSDEAEAREFLRLLLAGNPDMTLRGYGLVLLEVEAPDAA